MNVGNSAFETESIMDINNLGLGAKLTAAFDLLCDVVIELYDVLFSGGGSTTLERWRYEDEHAIGTRLTPDLDRFHDPLNDDR
jgi:hypothetical protein